MKYHHSHPLNSPCILPSTSASQLHAASQHSHRFLLLFNNPLSPINVALVHGCGASTGARQVTGHHSPKEERSSLPLAAFNENHTWARAGSHKLLFHLCWEFGRFYICSGKSNSPDMSGRQSPSPHPQPRASSLLWECSLNIGVGVLIKMSSAVTYPPHVDQLVDAGFP